MRTVPLAEVKTHLSALVDEVVRTHEELTVTRKGRPAAVILSVDEYESIMETLELLRDPEAMAAVAEGQADIAAGRVYTAEQVAAELAERRRLEDQQCATG